MQAMEQTNNKKSGRKVMFRIPQHKCPCQLTVLLLLYPAWSCSFTLSQALCSWITPTVTPFSPSLRWEMQTRSLPHHRRRYLSTFSFLGTRWQGTTWRSCTGAFSSGPSFLKCPQYQFQSPAGDTKGRKSQRDISDTPVCKTNPQTSFSAESQNKLSWQGSVRTTNALHSTSPRSQTGFCWWQ